MGITQKYGIKYPFTSDNEEGIFMDLNETVTDGVKSKVLHLIFTPRGSKLRDPDFGTNLVRFIFNQNNEESFNDIKSEISEQVLKYVPKVEFRDIEIYKDENDENSIVVLIEYGVKKGNNIEITTVGVKL